MGCAKKKKKKTAHKCPKYFKVLLNFVQKHQSYQTDLPLLINILSFVMSSLQKIPQVLIWRGGVIYQLNMLLGLVKNIFIAVSTLSF